MFSQIILLIVYTTLALKFKTKATTTTSLKTSSVTNDIKLLQSNDGSTTLGITSDGTTFAIGNTQNIQLNHPVIQKVLERWKEDSKPGRRTLGDTDKIALSIEGGGMRGCVSAGATAALHYLGLNDAVDVVYGSSAGAMVAAYFISRQFAGVQIYHDILPSAGKSFINKLKLLIAAGVPNWLVKVIITQLGGGIQSQPEPIHNKTKKKISNKARKSLSTSSRHYTSLPGTMEISGGMLAAVFRRHAIVPSNDVFNLDFLLNQVMRGTQKLDWELFQQNERYQPLHIIACSTQRLETVALSRKKGNYCDLNSLLACIRASMSVPGVTGPMMAISHRKANDNDCDNDISDPTSTALSMSDSELKIPFPIAYGSHNFQKSDSAILPIINYKNVPSPSLSPHAANATDIPLVSSLFQSTNLLKRWYAFVSKWRNKSVIRIAFLWKYFSAVFLSYLVPNGSPSATLSPLGAAQLSGRMSVETSKLNRPSLGLSKSSLSSGSASTSVRTSRSTVLSSSGSSLQVPNPSTEPNKVTSESYEGLIDAFVSEPIPYRSAVRDGATHILVLRTKPDSCVIKRKGPGVFEKFIARRFLKKYKEVDAVKWMTGMEHVRIYIEDSK